MEFNRQDTIGLGGGSNVVKNNNPSNPLIVSLLSLFLKIAKLWFDVLLFPLVYLCKAFFSLLLKLTLPALEQINRYYISPVLENINKNKYTILKYGITAWTIFVVSITFALITYLFLYYLLIPKVYTDTPLYFDFEHPLSPHATTTLPQNTFQSHFKYHISILLELPESKENTNLGMFMVQLNVSSPPLETKPQPQTQSTKNTNVTIGEVSSSSSSDSTQQNTLLLQTTRPGVLRHKTSLMRIIYTVFYSPLFLIGFEEKQALLISLAEGAILPISNTPQFFILNCSLSKSEIQVYTASLQIHTELSGWRYCMKYWPITSFFVGVFSLFTFYAFSILITIVYIYWKASQKPQPTSVFDEEISFEMPLRFVNSNNDTTTSNINNKGNIIGSNSSSSSNNIDNPQIIETQTGSDDSNNDDTENFGQEENEDDGSGLGLSEANPLRKRERKRRHSTPK